MLYRPKFCAECGERIVRADWPLLVSRRFCDLCSSVNKGVDLIPRAVLAAGLLAGLLGTAIGFRTVPPNSYSEKGSKRALTAAPSTQNAGAAPAAVESPHEQKLRSASAVASRPETAPAAKRDAAPNESVHRSTPPVLAVEERYFCGAETRKGTPCSRRVKGPKRCFQHEGAPAMVAQKELLIR